jgi:hypothetical protein
MGLRDLRVEQQTAGDGSSLTLEARTGESLEILARGIGGGGANAIVEESVREETMLAYQADDTDGIDTFPREATETQHTDLLARLREMGYMAPTIKVPEGHDYTIAPDDSSSSITVLYREGGANQWARTDPGGPDNPTRTFIALGEEDSALSSGGTAEEFQVTTATTPSPLSGFPYEEDAPQGFEYDLIALMVDSDDSDGSNTPVIDNFRLETEETSFLAREDDTVRQEHAQYPSNDLTTMPFVFPDPPTILPGQELKLFVTKNAASGTDVQAATAMVFHRRSVR